MSYNKRIRKKRIKKLLNEILETGYFINCNFHPVRLTEYGYWAKDVWGTDVDGVALTNGGKCSCSIAHCGPEPITEAVALEMVEVYKQQGDRGLAVKYGGYTDDAYTEFEMMWR